jgi:G3E family GTPase
MAALTNLIVASALEAVDSDALVAQHQAAIRKQAQIHNFSAAQISQKLHHDLSAANVHHYTLTAETMYEPNEQGNKNAQIWFEAETLKDAKAMIQQVIFFRQPLHFSLLRHLLAKVSGNRIKPQYRSGGSLATAVEKKPINLAQVILFLFLSKP